MSCCVQDFSGCINCVEKVQSYKPKQCLDLSKGRFDCKTLYKLDYRGCMGERAHSLKPKTYYVPSDGKMQKCTTYKDAYVPFCSERVQSLKPKTCLGLSKYPMDCMSLYRVEYGPKCCAKRQPFTPHQEIDVSCFKFCGLTNYRNDFKPFTFCPKKRVCKDDCRENTYNLCGRSQVCGYRPIPAPRYEKASCPENAQCQCC